MQVARTFGSFAVNDVEAAKSFYTDVMGVEVDTEHDPASDSDILWIHSKDEPPVMVYPKPDHTPAGFTVYNFEVDDIDAAADELKDRGATLERYEQMQPDDKGIVRMGGLAAAWLKDPSGNVVGLMQRTG